MSTPEGNSKPVGLSRDQWAAFKRRWLKGESVTSLANHYQITQVSIYKMIKRQGWTRSLCGAKLIGDSGSVAKSPNRNSQILAATDENEHNSLISSELSPQEFQSALSQNIKRLIVAGISSIEPPRTANELKTMVEMVRKADGLDNQGVATGNTPLMGGLRTVSRRVIDVAADPLDGFEV